VDAVGICKSCGRGLSRAAAAEFPQGLACRNRCEADVQRLIRAGAAASAGAGNSVVNTAVSGVFSMLAGGGFIYFTDGFVGGLTLTNFMGGAFILFGLYSVGRALWLRRRPRENSPAS
jgi:small-conductance mechanosensitive channel